MNNNLHQSLTVTVGSEKKQIGHSDIICPVCKKGQVTDPVVHAFESISIVRCSNCCTMHLYPMPDEESLNAIYNNNYYKDETQTHGYFDYAAEKKSIEKTYIRRMQFVKKTLGKKITEKTRLHEIGCALGIGLSALNAQLSTSVSGSDISKDAEAACREMGIPFYRSDSQGRHPLDYGQKDVVLIFDVIEHLSDISKFIAFLDELLPDDGHLVITTPNMKDPLNRLLGARSPSIKIPQHTIYFDTDSLSSALADKFKLIGHTRDYQYVPFSRLFERILHIFGLRSGLFEKFHAEFLVPNGMEIYLFQKRNYVDE